MPVKITWGNEAKTFTLFEFSGKWTWEEYYAVRAQGIEMVNSVGHMVNIIVNIKNASILPSNFLTNIQSSVHSAPKFDLCIIVNTSSLLTAFINVISKLRMPIKIVSTKSLEEAYAIMEKYEVKKLANL